MKKKLLGTMIVASLGWSMLMWNSFAIEQSQLWMQQKIHNRYETIKEKLKDKYAKASNYIKEKTSNVDIQKIKEWFKERMLKFKESLPSNATELKQKYYELKNKIATATSTERQEIYTKLSMIKQKYYGLANRPHTNTVTQQTHNVVLSSQVKQKIDRVVEIKLFNRIKNLSNEKQIVLLSKIHSKIVTINNRIKAQLNNNYSKTLDYKKQILSYLDQKIVNKIEKLKESNQVSVESILSEALWN